MGCINSKQQKGKEINNQHEINEYPNSLKDKENQQKLNNNQKDDNITSKFTIDPKNNDDINHNKIQNGNNNQNQNNGKQNNNGQYHQQDQNNHDQQSNGKSQTEIIKVTGQSQQDQQKNKSKPNLESTQDNKDQKNINPQQQKNEQRQNLQKNQGQDGEECNVDDIEEGVYVNAINNVNYSKQLNQYNNQSNINQQNQSQKKNIPTNKKKPLNSNNNNLKNNQNANSNNNININSNNQIPLNNNNNNDNIKKDEANQNQPQSNAIIINQEEAAAQQQKVNTVQYIPFEIKKLNEEQEQKAMEQYEKLLLDQQKKQSDNLQFSADDSNKLRSLIPQSIKNLDWLKALYYNTSLLRIELKQFNENKNKQKKQLEDEHIDYPNEILELIFQQIDLLIRNSKYHEALFIANNYLEKDQPIVNYIFGNQCYTEGKYLQGFQLIKSSIDNSIAKNIKIKPEYIICLCSCLYEMQDTKTMIEQLDSLLKNNNAGLKTPENLNAIAEQYARIKKYDQAKDILKNIINSFKDNYNAYINLALIYINNDESKKAKEFLNKALSIINNDNNINKNSIDHIFLNSIINSC